jgi:hypothetical protein
MKIRYAVLLATAATVALSSTAAARPEAPRQQVAITTWGVADVSSVQKFELIPLGSGSVEPDSGTGTSVIGSRRIVTRDGQTAEIVTWISTQKGKRGSFVVRTRIEHIDAGKGFHIGTGTWRFVRGTGAYAGMRGGGRVSNAWISFGSHGISERWDGFLTAP